MSCDLKKTHNLGAFKAADYSNTSILGAFGSMVDECARKEGGLALMLLKSLSSRTRLGEMFFVYERLRRYGVGSPMIEEDGMWCF
jgi:hypothetical protein